MNSPNLKYRDLILVLALEFNLMKDLFSKNKKYDILLSAINKYTDKDGLPYQKDLMKELGIPRSKLLKLMNELYEEFKSKLGTSHDYNINETEILIFVKYLEDYWCFGIDRLDYLPRKGEDFVVEFARGSIGGGNFKVVNIIHKIEQGVHTVQIYLEDYSVRKGLADWQ